MLPIFPKFTPLAISLKAEIEKITNIYPPYSDFNFVSLWCWDLSKRTELSLLNENLVIRMEDYATAEIFYMFLGINEINETIAELFVYLKNNGLNQELSLIPEETIMDNIKDLESKYVLEEDRDNFDYIVSVDNLSEMKGHELHQKRKLLNKFLNNNNPEIEVVKIGDSYIKEQVLGFFEIWKKNKGEYDSKNEEIALNNLFTGLSEQDNIYVLIATLNNTTVGFSIFEILKSGYAVGDFQKADIHFKGIYEFLNFSIAKFIKEKGCKFYNIEQDLGIEALRRAKLDYDPTFLKKYTVKQV